MKCKNHNFNIVLITLLVVVGTTSLYYNPNLSVFVPNVLGQEDSEDDDSEDNSDENSDDNGSDESSEEEGSAVLPPTPATNATEGILAYLDSQGRFRIGYPADAIVMPLQDLPGGVVSISSPGIQNITSVDLRITDLEDTEIELEEHVTSVLAGLENSSIPNFSPIQTAECETYTLAGEEACSIIYSGDIRAKNNALLPNATVMQLYSLLDSSLYNIAYTAPGIDFSNNLRILEPMLNSFELLDGPGDLGPIPRFHNLTAQQN